MGAEIKKSFQRAKSSKILPDYISRSAKNNRAINIKHAWYKSMLHVKEEMKKI